MEAFLELNGATFATTVDDQERVILAMAAGELDRAACAAWVVAHTHPLPTD
jgi:prophage maintenance system killer protein